MRKRVEQIILTDSEKNALEAQVRKLVWKVLSNARTLKKRSDLYSDLNKHLKSKDVFNSAVDVIEIIGCTEIKVPGNLERAWHGPDTQAWLRSVVMKEIVL